MTIIITGREAIAHADRAGEPLNKFQDPIEAERWGITPAEAAAIAAVDPSLVWIEVEGQAFDRSRDLYRHLCEIMGAASGIEPTTDEADAMWDGLTEAGYIICTPGAGWALLAVPAAAWDAQLIAAVYAADPKEG